MQLSKIGEFGLINNIRARCKSSSPDILTGIGDDAAVVKKAQNGFIMIKVDVTKGGNPTHERLLQEYGIKGVPTVVFLNADGKECQELRLLDFLPPDQMLTRMSQLQKSGS